MSLEIGSNKHTPTVDTAYHEEEQSTGSSQDKVRECALNHIGEISSPRFTYILEAQPLKQYSDELDLGMLFSGSFYPQKPVLHSDDSSVPHSNEDLEEQSSQSDEDLFACIPCFPKSHSTTTHERINESESLKKLTVSNEDISEILSHISLYPKSHAVENTTSQSINESPIQSLEQLPEDDVDIGPQYNVSLKKIAEEQDVFSAFSQFYSLVLNSKPLLEPQFGGSFLYYQIPQLKKTVESFLDSLDSIEDKEEIAALRNCCDVLEKAQGISYKNFDVDNAAETMVEDLAQMSIGASYLIPSGASEHTMCYELIRQADDSYFFTIINTGEDQEYGSRLKNSRSKDREGHVLYADKGYIVNKSMLDKDFLKSILMPSVQRFSTEQVLDHIDEALVNKRGARSKEGHIHHAQERDNCSYKCLTRYTAGHLNDLLGVEKGTALNKRFKVFRTEQEWAKIQKLIEQSDKDLLKKAFKVTSEEGLNVKLKAMSDAYAEILAKRKKKASQSVEMLTT